MKPEDVYSNETIAKIKAMMQDPEVLIKLKQNNAKGIEIEKMHYENEKYFSALNESTTGLPSIPSRAEFIDFMKKAYKLSDEEIDKRLKKANLTFRD